MLQIVRDIETGKCCKSANLILKEAFESQDDSRLTEVGVFKEAGFLEYWFQTQRDFLASIP